MRLGHTGTPVKYLASDVRELNLDLSENNLLSLSYGRIIRKDIDSNEGLLPASFDRYTKVRPGDTVMRLTDLQNDQRSLRTGLVTQFGIITSAYLTLRPSESVDARYLSYSLHAIDAAKSLYALGGGLRQSMGMEEVGNLRLNLPSIVEQRRIADFLDNQVARIDVLADSRRRQVELIAQLSESRISRAYSEQGKQEGLLRLAVDIQSLAQGWSPQCDDRPPDEGEWGVLRAGCVNGGVFRPNDVKAMPSDLIPREEFIVKQGDFLVNRASGSLNLIGCAAVVGPEVRPRTLLCDKVYRLVLNGRWSVEYAAIMWCSREIREHLRHGVSGAEGMANSLPGGVIRDIRLPNLNRAEQSRWCHQQNEYAGALERSHQRFQDSIAVLTQYKRSLITAAVTGEFDVSAASGRGAHA